MDAFGTRGGWLRTTGDSGRAVEIYFGDRCRMCVRRIFRIDEPWDSERQSKGLIMDDECLY